MTLAYAAELLRVPVYSRDPVYATPRRAAIYPLVVILPKVIVCDAVLGISV